MFIIPIGQFIGYDFIKQNSISKILRHSLVYLSICDFHFGDSEQCLNNNNSIAIQDFIKQLYTNNLIDLNFFCGE